MIAACFFVSTGFDSLVGYGLSMQLLGSEVRCVRVKRITSPNEWSVRLLGEEWVHSKRAGEGAYKVRGLVVSDVCCRWPVIAKERKKHASSMLGYAVSPMGIRGD
jgi:hypothetical protein